MATNKKQCVTCHRYLPADADHFYKRADSADGFRGDCKECKVKNTLSNRSKRQDAND